MAVLQDIFACVMYGGMPSFYSDLKNRSYMLL